MQMYARRSSVMVKTRLPPPLQLAPHSPDALTFVAAILRKRSCGRARLLSMALMCWVVCLPVAGEAPRRRHASQREGKVAGRFFFPHVTKSSEQQRFRSRGVVLRATLGSAPPSLRRAGHDTSASQAEPPPPQTECPRPRIDFYKHQGLCLPPIF